VVGRRVGVGGGGGERLGCMQPQRPVWWVGASGAAAWRRADGAPWQFVKRRSSCKASARPVQVENFPAFIVCDDKGNDFFAEFGM